MGSAYDAVIVGAGPNGLTAATMLARAGRSVLVIEQHPEPGGGCRTAELTLPGFSHDACAAIHPMGALSPAFRELGLEDHGLKWVQPAAPLAHPLENGDAALIENGLAETAAALGRDRAVWTGLLDHFLGNASALFECILRPIRIPKHPALMARFGMQALRSCEGLIAKFHTVEARALLAGCGAHAILPLDQAGTASFSLVLALSAHAIGWPSARGGSGRIIDALVKVLRESGGRIETGRTVRSMDDLPKSRAVLFDLTPHQIERIAGSALPERYLRRSRRFKMGPGVFKVDWALDGPVPWSNPKCARAATVHLGGTAEEIIASEAQVGRGLAPERPFVLFAQQSLFDPERAPAGKHTGWAYCHVPNGCTEDMTERIEAQIERFAPGFRDLILARHIRTPAQFERYNPNFIGGDITGGANTLMQSLFRPFPRWNPYSTPNPRLFICSSSTPPGGGVHGMCGYWAAKTVLGTRFNHA